MSRVVLIVYGLSLLRRRCDFTPLPLHQLGVEPWVLRVKPSAFHQGYVEDVGENKRSSLSRQEMLLGCFSQPGGLLQAGNSY